MGKLTRGDEYRCIARDLVGMGRPDLAKQAWALAHQIDREETIMDFMQAVAAAAADVGSAYPSKEGE